MSDAVVQIASARTSSIFSSLIGESRAVIGASLRAALVTFPEAVVERRSCDFGRIGLAIRGAVAAQYIARAVFDQYLAVRLGASIRHGRLRGSERGWESCRGEIVEWVCDRC